MTRIAAKGRIADINVTPMADVIIVLLIIFMVTVPLIDEGPVRKLPEATHVRAQQRGPIVVSIAADSSLFVGGVSVTTEADLTERRRARLEASTERIIHVKADPGLPYATVARVLATCRAAGAEDVAFIATPKRT